MPRRTPPARLKEAFFTKDYTEIQNIKDLKKSSKHYETLTDAINLATKMEIMKLYK